MTTLLALFDRRRWLLLLLVALVLLGLYAPEVLAQDVGQTRYKGVLDAFSNQAALWQTTLTQSARWLFFMLAIFSFLWANIGLALKGGDISDAINVNVREILRIGFMYVLLVRGYDWATAVVNSFRQAGQSAVLASGGTGGAGLDPANIFQNGVMVASQLMEQGSSWNLLDNVGLIICALLLIVVFAFVAAFMAVAIVESFIVIGGAVFLLGFGGSTITADIAKRTAMYCISVGAKLFVMQLIVGVAMGAVVDWANTYQQDNSTSMLSLIGLVLLVAILAKSIPETVQGLLSGTSFAGPGAMLSTVAASAAAVTAAGAAVGAAGGAASAAAKGASNGATATLGGMGGAGGGGMGAAAGSMFSAAAPHMGRAATAMMDAGSGINMGGALASMSGSLRPDAPSMTGEGGGGDGGTISGQAASPSEPSLGGGAGGGGNASPASGSGARQAPQQGAAGSASQASAQPAASSAGVVAGLGASLNGTEASQGKSTQSDSAPTESSGASGGAAGLSGEGAPISNPSGVSDAMTLDERHDAAGVSATDSPASSSSQPANQGGSATSAPVGGRPQSGGQAGGQGGGAGAGSVANDLQSSDSQAPVTPPNSEPVTLDERGQLPSLDNAAYANDGPLPSLDNAAYANDGPQAGGRTASVAQPSTLPSGGVGATARDAASRARKQFGLDATSAKPTDSGPSS